MESIDDVLFYTVYNKLITFAFRCILDQLGVIMPLFRCLLYELEPEAFQIQIYYSLVSKIHILYLYLHS